MLARLGFKVQNFYRKSMTSKFSQTDVMRWRGGIGLFMMLSLGFLIEEWYYYSPHSKPMSEDTFLQYIQRRKDFFKKKEVDDK